jgi:uncharacterized peroxidase-related enzyme
MSWIKTISYEDAVGKLRKLYDKVKGPDNNVDNVLMVHSLRPHSLVGHMAIYKNVLHNSNNTLPKWYLEILGVYVSHLNNCQYCVQHHFAGLKRLLNDDDVQSEKIYASVQNDNFLNSLTKEYIAGAEYARKLTLELPKIIQEDVDKLKTLGFTDGEILEINQVTSYFNYVNRSVLGLGVNTDGDVLGLSPNKSDDPDNWSHK